MSSIDLSTLIKTESAFNLQEITTNTTTAGNIIDTAGFESLDFVLLAGTITTGVFTPVIEDGDDSGLSDAAAVADDFLIGTEVAAVISGSGASDSTRRIGYVGKKRYVRLSEVSSGTASGFVAAVAIKSAPRTAPTAVDE